ncbi:MAG: ribosome-binding factor A [Candidatus Pacebacteria bacterium]|jgi:ribosome-binding factor A|nr:ribosome-binding factor A [Candidatus Paceibacterota bacterium]
MSLRQDKVGNLIRELAGRFIQEESNKTSLITVTEATISKDMKRATIFFTVFPAEKEEAVLDFLKRKRSEFHDYLKGKLETRAIPFVDFEIDRGEKNRQRIDELLANS